MVTARSLLVLALAFGVAAAQEEEAPAADGESEEAAEEPVKCPIGGGGFQELYAVAVLLSHQDKLAEAEVCLSDAITTTVPAYRMLSDIATVNSQFGRAAAIAEIIETLTNNGDAKLYYARKLLRIDQNEKAKERLDVLIEHNGENAEIRHLLGVAQFRMDQPDDAIANLKKAIELEPETELYKTELETLEKAIAEGGDKGL
jgi:tetratricopeptide (TPR) repeat protein